MHERIPDPRCAWVFLSALHAAQRGCGDEMRASTTFYRPSAHSVGRVLDEYKVEGSKLMSVAKGGFGGFASGRIERGRDGGARRAIVGL